MVSESRGPGDKLYTIQCSARCFQTGRSSRDEQVLVGLVADGLVAVFFSPRGDFLRAEHRNVDLPPAAGQSDYKQWEAESALLWAAFDSWADELGLVYGDIKVERFWLDKWSIGIEDLPDCFRRFLRNPLSIKDEKQQKQWQDDIAEWRREENYILWWRAEYWMAKDGHVFAT
jgi:hypothetical protein